MGQVTLTVAGRSHSNACRDGEELHLERLGALLERHSETAVRASGGLSGERTMFFLALILADLLDEAERRTLAGACSGACAPWRWPRPASSRWPRPAPPGRQCRPA